MYKVKNILKIIVLLLPIAITSCKTGTMYTAKDTSEKLAVFKILDIEDDYVRIEKLRITITRQDKTEESYQLLLPNIGLYYASGTINSIPSNHNFKYDNGSSIYIVSNSFETNIGRGFYKLKKQELLDLIWQNHISILDKVKIKKEKHNGVFFYDGIAILYTNVKEKDLELFNKSISSLKK